MANGIKGWLETLSKGLTSLKTIQKDKRAYRDYVERIKALPDDYGFVYRKIADYLWSYAGGGDGYDMLTLQDGLLELFEAGTADGKAVLEVTGADVAAFCDELLRNADTYTAARRDKLNRTIQKRRGVPSAMDKK